MTLEAQKAKAKSEYIKARDAWTETRTKENPYGDRTLWEQFCEAKRQCRLWGIISPSPKPCYMCDNAKVNDELTDENDLSYISIGKSGGSHRMFIRSGDGKPIQILVEQFIKDDWHLAAIYEPLYCPNCGRKLIEQEAENEADK